MDAKAMLRSLRKFINEITAMAKDNGSQPGFDIAGKKLAAAALMFHVIAADGVVKPKEREKLRAILNEHYEVSEADIDELIEQATKADSEAVDLYTFTSILKRELSRDERILLVEDLWEMVFADDEMNEFEDNIVWRVAELIAVSPQDRISMKRRVQARNS